ncbi:hypothetical protein [Streptomyces sp. Agncl-13]
MRGNFLGVPTDCPRHDERLGPTRQPHVRGSDALREDGR